MWGGVAIAGCCQGRSLGAGAFVMMRGLVVRTVAGETGVPTLNSTFTCGIIARFCRGISGFLLISEGSVVKGVILVDAIARAVGVHVLVE